VRFRFQVNLSFDKVHLFSFESQFDLKKYHYLISQLRLV